MKVFTLMENLTSIQTPVSSPGPPYLFETSVILVGGLAAEPSKVGLAHLHS